MSGCGRPIASAVAQGLAPSIGEGIDLTLNTIASVYGDWDPRMPTSTATGNAETSNLYGDGPSITAGPVTGTHTAASTVRRKYALGDGRGEWALGGSNYLSLKGDYTEVRNWGRGDTTGGAFTIAIDMEWVDSFHYLFSTGSSSDDNMIGIRCNSGGSGALGFFNRSGGSNQIEGIAPAGTLTEGDRILIISFDCNAGTGSYWVDSDTGTSFTPPAGMAAAASRDTGAAFFSLYGTSFGPSGTIVRGISVYNAVLTDEEAAQVRAMYLARRALSANAGEYDYSLATHERQVIAPTATNISTVRDGLAANPDASKLWAMDAGYLQEYTWDGTNAPVAGDQADITSELTRSDTLRYIDAYTLEIWNGTDDEFVVLTTDTADDFTTSPTISRYASPSTLSTVSGMFTPDKDYALVPLDFTGQHSIYEFIMDTPGTYASTFSGVKLARNDFMSAQRTVAMAFVNNGKQLLSLSDDKELGLFDCPTPYRVYDRDADSANYWFAALVNQLSDVSGENAMAVPSAGGTILIADLSMWIDKYTIGD